MLTASQRPSPIQFIFTWSPVVEPGVELTEAKDDFELLILLPLPPSAAIGRMSHHPQFVWYLRSVCARPALD